MCPQGIPINEPYPRCLDCGKTLSSRSAKRCHDCFHNSRKGENHPMFGVKRFGEKAGNWKGGKAGHQRGYVRVHSPNHPSADNQGYVFEHRLVIEKHIGRFLKKTEVVHHVNKIHSDNRLENLMLFESQKAHLNFHKQERIK